MNISLHDSFWEHFSILLGVCKSNPFFFFFLNLMNIKLVG